MPGTDCRDVYILETGPSKWPKSGGRFRGTSDGKINLRRVFLRVFFPDILHSKDFKGPS